MVHQKLDGPNHRITEETCPEKFLPNVNLPVDSIMKYFKKSLEYAERYLCGDSILAAKMAIKEKSHRAVPASEAFNV